MPEGPSIVILKEETAAFAGKRVLEVSGNAKIDLGRLNRKTIRSIQSWGKHFLVCFDGFYLRVHFLLFGSYRLNERREMNPRLSLRTRAGELNLYNCSVKLLDGSPAETYDRSVDVMSDTWDPVKAVKKFRKKRDAFVCDLLLDQELFAGSGNIIKNEVLFRKRVHPLSLSAALPLKKVRELVNDVADYSWEFYKWKKAYVLRKHWQVYKKKYCPNCGKELVRTWAGKTNRLTFYCGQCQVLY